MKITQLNADEFEKWCPQLRMLLQEAMKNSFDKTLLQASYYDETLKKLKQYLKKEQAIVFLAVTDDRLDGWVWCHEIRRLGKINLHVSSFAVAPDSRNSGIGSKLFNVIENYAKTHAYDGIDLLVTSTNKTAISFYDKQGFEIERLLLKKDI